MELLGIKVTKEEFDYLMLEQENGKELVIVDGKVLAVNHELTEKEIIEEQILALKKNLFETDFITNKLAECETEEERKQLRLKYATQLSNRKMWRKEINNLEEKLKNL